jgi:ATP adenylyltransferase
MNDRSSSTALTIPATSNLPFMDHLWAGWRSAYINAAGEPDPDGCLFCRLPGQSDRKSLIVAQGKTVFTALNRYPYTTGHVMIAPLRHVDEPGAMSEAERSEVWASLAAAQRAIQRAMSPAGFNLGANLGRVAGAGVPGHFHMHLVPRWEGDANFMTAVGSTRVIPEDLADTWEKLRAALASSTS